MKYWIIADIKRSPVYETMHISGDCLCGCFAKEQELPLLKMFHPEVYEEIKRIEKLIPQKGSDVAKKYSTWGNHNQSTLNVEAKDDAEAMICAECFYDGDKDESKAQDTSYLREQPNTNITKEEAKIRKKKREAINKAFKESQES